MIWYNEDKTIGLNLDLVSFWVYKGDLQLFVPGGPVHLYGKDAEQVYKMLTDKKEVL